MDGEHESHVVLVGILGDLIQKGKTIVVLLRCFEVSLNKEVGPNSKFD